MKLKFCGAAQNVTGSNHLLEVNGLRILLDCGMFQGGGYEKARLLNEQFLYDPASIDFVIISHGHIDHVGRLPYLYKGGFRGKVFCTKATKELSRALLLDSAHIQKQDLEYINKEFNKKVEPLYEEKEVEEVLKLFITHEYEEKFELTIDVSVTFFEAGHVLGSAQVCLDYREKGDRLRRLVFTGDLGRKYMPLLNDPKQIEKADILITESTYASHLHDSFSSVHDELQGVINDVYARGGKIIIPGFSFERTQELVYVLHQLYDQKRIPAIPIFVDSPLAVEISQVFEKFSSYYDKETFRDFLDKKRSPFFFEQVKYLKTVEESKALNFHEGPCIIISASGMCEAGRIKHHLKNNIGNPKNLILVVGFMAQGTRGRDIVEGKRKIRLFGQLYPLKAEVVVMNSFSAHADKLELLDYIRAVKDLENIFIVHGEESECSVLRDNIINILKLRCRIDIADMGEEFEVDKNGTQSNLGRRREQYLKELDKINL